MQRAIFFDRDNTLIDEDGYLGDPNGVRLMKGAASAIASLRGLGYKIVVVTNQSGVARGMFTEADVEAVHTKLANLVEQHANGASIDRFYYCPYLPDAPIDKYDQDHPWRKPKPGMLLQAAKDMKLDLSLCWMVGDAARDVEAGQAAGVRTVLIGEDDGESSVEPEYTAETLVEAARIIAQHLKPEVEAAPDAEPVVVKTQAVKEEPLNPNAGPTYPAVQKLETTTSSSQPTVHNTSRPFKPWSIQPVTEEQAEAAELNQSTGIKTPLPVTQVNIPKPQAPTPPAVAKRARKPKTVAPSEPPAAAQPADEPREAEAPSEDQPSPTDRLLQQILRQLKGNQLDHADWSMFRVIGMALAQPLALFCAMIGVIGVGATGNWLLGAVFFQLVVITCLLLHGQR